MPYVWRTTGPWGPGKGGNLTPTELDGNFWQAVQDIAAKAAQGVGIANFVVHGDQMTVVLTDHTLLGPYKLPVAVISFQGEWAPDTYYNANDIITHAGSTFIVLVNHTSQATFDPDATNGMGQNLYGLLLENPTLQIPVGGAAGAFLRKVTSADYVTHWATAALTDLSDVSLSSPPPSLGEVLTFNGSVWIAQPVSTVFSLSLSELTDVLISTSPAPVAGQVLAYNGTEWTNQVLTAILGFAPSITLPVGGQVLVYDAAEGMWENANTADIPVYTVGTLSGTIALDYANGGVQRLGLASGTTLDHVANWPPSGQFGRLLLEITNSGPNTFTWPLTYHWPGGAAPEVTFNGRDIFTLTTFDGGTNVDGTVIGQGFI